MSTNDCRDDPTIARSRLFLDPGKNEISVTDVTFRFPKIVIQTDFNNSPCLKQSNGFERSPCMHPSFRGRAFVIKKYFQSGVFQFR